MFLGSEVRRADNPAATISQPYRPLKPVTEIALLYFLLATEHTSLHGKWRSFVI
jgi:hypothetical protein